MEAQIEVAKVVDAEAILSLQRKAYQSEAALYQDWSIPPLTETLKDLQSEFGQMTVLKAVATAGLVGSVRGTVKGSTCAVGRLIVDPKFQRRGIGSQLMRSLELLFPAVARFELFTGSRSEVNIRLYEHLGYRIFRTQVLSPKVTLVFMEKINVGA
jgi:ribosomal protein S18 acetylase RimI-like enzyme